MSRGGINSVSAEADEAQKEVNNAPIHQPVQPRQLAITLHPPEGLYLEFDRSLYKNKADVRAAVYKQ
jgi:hypothetical protein